MKRLILITIAASLLTACQPLHPQSTVPRPKIIREKSTLACRFYQDMKDIVSLVPQDRALSTEFIARKLRSGDCFNLDVGSSYAYLDNIDVFVKIVGTSAGKSRTCWVHYGQIR